MQGARRFSGYPLGADPRFHAVNINNDGRADIVLSVIGSFRAAASIATLASSAPAWRGPRRAS
jgi:hypothetical protein